MATPLPRRTAGLTAAALMLLAPTLAGAPASPASGASAASEPAAELLPRIRTVYSLTPAIGDTLTIRGHNFRKGRGENFVVFRRAGAAAVFVKADIGTEKLIRVQIPDRLAASLTVQDGVQVPTRFSLRILSARLGRAYTEDRYSPVIAPAPVPPTGA